MHVMLEDANSPTPLLFWIILAEGAALPADLPASAQIVRVRITTQGTIFLAWRWRPDSHPPEEAPEMWAVSPRGQVAWAAPRFPEVHHLDDLALLEMVPRIARFGPAHILVQLRDQSLLLDAAKLEAPSVG